MPGVLDDDSFSSKGEDSGGGDASLPSDVKVGSVDRRPMKAPVVEESEDEPEHQPPPSWHLNPTPSIGSQWLEDIEMDPARGTLFLSKSFLLCFLFHLVFALYACR
jgi:hypothetical protein